MSTIDNLYDLNSGVTVGTSAVNIKCTTDTEASYLTVYSLDVSSHVTSPFSGVVYVQLWAIDAEDGGSNLTGWFRIDLSKGATQLLFPRGIKLPTAHEIAARIKTASGSGKVSIGANFTATTV